MTPTFHLFGYDGFGDMLYLRPTIAAMLRQGLKVEVACSWPIAFHDFIERYPGYFRAVERTERVYECQKRTIEEQRELFREREPYSSRVKRVRLDYNARNRERGQNLIRAFQWNIERQTGLTLSVNEADMLLPVIPGAVSEAMRRTNQWRKKLGNQPLWIVRPPTLRGDWCRPRNPSHAAWRSAFEMVDTGGTRTVGIADINKQERFDGEKPAVDMECWGDNMPLASLIEVVRCADAVLMPVCFMLPLAIATRTIGACVFGGHAAPRWLIPSSIGASIEPIAPHPFCDCWNSKHDCPKEIPEDRLRSSIQRVLDAGDARWHLRPWAGAGKVHNELAASQVPGDGVDRLLGDGVLPGSG